MGHSIVAETGEAVFVYDKTGDKLARWRVKSLLCDGTQTDLNSVTVCDIDLRRTRYTIAPKSKGSSCMYRRFTVIAQLWDRKETGGRGERQSLSL